MVRVCIVIIYGFWKKAPFYFFWKKSPIIKLLGMSLYSRIEIIIHIISYVLDARTKNINLVDI